MFADDPIATVLFVVLFGYVIGVFVVSLPDVAGLAIVKVNDEAAFAYLKVSVRVDPAPAAVARTILKLLNRVFAGTIDSTSASELLLAWSCGGEID